MKKRKRGGQKAHASSREKKITRLAAQLAPMEECAASVSQGELPEDGFIDGSIIVDSERLPQINLLTDEAEEPCLRIPLVAVVAAIALAFTAFIAYLIANQTA